MKEEYRMPDYLCVMIVGSLVIGFILGRWRVPPDYCGDVIISADSETCTFALDIPADDIPSPQFYAGTAHGKTTCFARLATLHAMTGSIYED